MRRNCRPTSHRNIFKQGWGGPSCTKCCFPSFPSGPFFWALQLQWHDVMVLHFPCMHDEALELSYFPVLHQECVVVCLFFESHKK